MKNSKKNKKKNLCQINENLYFILSFLFIFFLILTWSYLKDKEGLTLLGKIPKLISLLLYGQ